jgi:hypothetical protein
MEGVIVAEWQRFIVVETNFAVFAYSDSPLRISLLALFADLVPAPSSPEPSPLPHPFRSLPHLACLGASLGLSPQRYQLAGMAVGDLTRKSVRRGFAKGITALQIIKFLQVPVTPFPPGARDPLSSRCP